MIYESFYWKEEIKRNLKWLNEAISKKRWSDRGYTKLEKCLMLSAYSIRKLYESKKIPKEFMDKKIIVDYYNKIENSNMTIMNNNYLERHYKLQEKHQKHIKVRELLNQIIHSYIFAPLFEENSNKIIEIFITSDYKKDELVYSVEYQKIINLFTYISEGDLVGYSFTKEEKKKKDGQTEKNKWDFVLTHAEYQSSIKLEEIK